MEKIRSYSAGSYIFKESEVGEEMFVIRKGKVKIVKIAQAEGKKVEKTLSILGPGEFFGEMSLLLGERRSANAIAEEPCELYVIDRATFQNLISTNPKIALAIIKRLAARLLKADKQIEELLVQDRNSRLVKCLLKIAKEKGIPESGGVKLPIANLAETLAQEAGVPLDVARKFLKKLELSEVVRGAADYLFIPSVKELEKLLDFLRMKEKYE